MIKIKNYQFCLTPVKIAGGIFDLRKFEVTKFFDIVIYVLKNVDLRLNKIYSF